MREVALMNNKSSEDSSRIGFIIAFIVVAVLSVICCIFVNSLIKKNNTKNVKDDSSASVAVTTEVSAESTSSEVTEDVDSIEILTEELASNLNEEFYFSDAQISYNGTKTFPFSFSRVFTSGDIFEKAAVTYSAGDSVINELKGGFGFNVTQDGIADSQNRSDSNEWFQGEDFYVTPGTNEYTLEYAIPENVRGKIDFGGECQVGYWYGQLNSLNVTKIAFFKTPSIKEITYNKKSTINGSINDFFFTDIEQYKLTFDLKNFSIPSGSQIQCISVKVQGENPINIVSGTFNISGCDNISIDRFSMEEPSENAIINFFINPDAAKDIDTENNAIELSLTNDTNDTLTVDTITVYYLTPEALKKLSS